MELNINYDLFDRIESVKQWKAPDGSLFYRIDECIGYQIIKVMEDAVNEYFRSDEESPTLGDCLSLLSNFMDTNVSSILQREQIQQMLQSDPYALEDIAKWIDSTKKYISGWRDALLENDALGLTKESELIISHWQCVDYPCYKINRISLSRVKSAWIYLSFMAGGQPHGRFWSASGYYQNEVSIEDLGRYLAKTKEYSHAAS